MGTTGVKGKIMPASTRTACCSRTAAHWSSASPQMVASHGIESKERLERHQFLRRR
jgi:hypothetical protein